MSATVCVAMKVKSYALGRLAGQALDTVLEGYHLNAGMYAIVGAAAMLGGVTRMVISLTVIIVEATGNVQFTLPVMIVLVTARAVGHRINTGLYDMYIEHLGVPFLEWSAPSWFSSLNASHVQQKPTCLQSVERAGTIVEVRAESRICCCPCCARHCWSFPPHCLFRRCEEPRSMRFQLCTNHKEGILLRVAGWMASCFASTSCLYCATTTSGSPCTHQTSVLNRFRQVFGCACCALHFVLKSFSFGRLGRYPITSSLHKHLIALTKC